MKWIKKINEGWSDDYVYDFKDHGFEIVDSEWQDGQSIKKVSGSYNGKFVITDVNDWFTEMMYRLDAQYHILKSKTFFNTTTNNASFEIDLTDKFLQGENYIDIQLSKGSLSSVRFYINAARALGSNDRHFDESTKFIINFRGIEENGRRNVLSFNISKKGKLYINFNNYNTKGIKVDKENLKKLIGFIEDNKINNNVTEEQLEEFKSRLNS